MNILKQIFILLAVFLSTSILAQQISTNPKVIITGKIVEKISQQPLEFATVALVNTKTNMAIAGAITDAKGEFKIETTSGNYNIKFEFISFKPQEIKSKQITENTTIGTISLEEDAAQLNEVVVRAEKSTVEIKLDKKIYNVGQDMIVKGGSASDVLDNVPSVTVDGEGNVALRGNENVRILIDGRPTPAVNIADALRNIPADALDKIEVITNPSARYDAEGGAGIINIVLKKGKNNGVNGTITGTIGDPRNNTLQGTINYKTEYLNIFSNAGYSNNNSLGNFFTNSDYLNPDGSVSKNIVEQTLRERGRKGYNYNLGFDFFVDKSLTFTTIFNYRKNDGDNPENSFVYNNDINNTFVQNRFNNQFTNTSDKSINGNITKKFKKEGHKLTIDASYSKDNDNDNSLITTSYNGNTTAETTIQSSKNLQKEKNSLIQTDYIVPLGKNGLFEAGYKGNFNNLNTDYNVKDKDANGNFIPNPNFTNLFDYSETINALYSQFGSKISKFSYLFGLRWEDSKIESNLLTTNNFNTKKYNYFFPSAFLTYEVKNGTNISLNYSRRISRPRSRFINPFSNYTSNINIFQGNPDINPSLTDAIDIGFLTKINKINFSTSMYYNSTNDVFQFIRRPNGEVITTVVNGETVETPVFLSTPVNIAKENRFGFEFNINYAPYKWWRLNTNFNLFQSKTSGSYAYSLVNSNEIISENLDNTALSWFARTSSKITLPYKIDWQTNATYNAPQNNAQGKSLGVLSANLALSKDVLKDKATIAFNVNDVFNSRKRISQTNLPSLNSYSEFQWRPRQINLSFTYRFNRNNNEKEKQKRQPQDENGGGEFGG